MMYGKKIFLAYCASWVLLSLLSTSVFAQQMHPKLKARMERWKTIDYGQTLVRDRPDQEMIDIHFNDLPRKIQSHMYSHLAFVLDREVHPQKHGQALKSGKMEVRVFSVWNGKQDDIVEYTWMYKEQGFRITASLNAMRLDIDLDELDSNPLYAEFGPDVVNKAHTLVSDVILLKGTDPYVGERPPPYEIHIAWPNSLEDGTLFSSNPEARIPHLMRWHQRIDFFVHDGVFSVLIYKTVPQLKDGFQDGSKWFDDDFRAWAHQKAREQGRVPKESEATDEE